MTSDFSPISIDLAREPDFSLGRLTVRPSLRQVESEGGSETLEPRIMQVLVALSQKRGEVVSRDELIQRCWDGRAVGEDALTRCISRLRKLGEASSDFSVETIPRVGYRLMAGAAYARSTAPTVSESAVQAGAPESFGKVARWIGRPLALAALAFVAFAAGAGVWLMSGGKDAVAAHAAGLRIAVLPFEVLADGPDAVLLARSAPTAIADALLEAGHQVVPPSLTQAYTAGRRRDAARELKATHVVHGEVSAEGGFLRLTARISGRDGDAIAVYPLKAQSAADLPAPAAARITYAFRWLTAMKETDADEPAEQAAILRSAESMSGQGVLKAYEAARRLADAGHGPTPITYLVIASGALPEASPGDRPRMLAEMREARRRMDERNAGPSMMHLADSMLLPEIDWAGRDAALRNSVDQPPLTGINAGLYSNFLLLAGRSREAETFARKHTTMEPTSPFGFSYLTMALLAQGRFDEARTEADRLEPLFPDNGTVAQMRYASLVWSGDIDAAEAMLAVPQFEDAIDPPARVRPARRLLSALRTRGSADIATLVAICKDASQLSASGAAMCLAGLGQLGLRDEAFSLLDSVLPDLRAATAEEREARWLTHPNAISAYAKLLMTPTTAPLREDPRIIGVFERIGLVEFWRETGKWPDFCETEPKSVCARMKPH